MFEKKLSPFKETRRKSILGGACKIESRKEIQKADVVFWGGIMCDDMMYKHDDNHDDKTDKKEQVIGSVLRQYEKEARAKGEIINPFIKQYLEAKIYAAKLILAIAMVMTILFKGRLFIWIVFIIMYSIYVVKEKEKALQADLKESIRK